MKKLFLFILLNLFIHSTAAKSFYDFPIDSHNQSTYKLSEMKGHVVMVVNIATRCGYTGQLDDLEKLYQKYKSKKFTIIGIPSNDFGGQTPESSKDAAKFCRLKYGATFPILEKTKVKGANAHPLVRFLTNMGKDKGEDSGKEIKWNFEKFIVDRSGKVAARYPSSVTPLNSPLEKQLIKLFAK